MDNMIIIAICIVVCCIATYIAYCKGHNKKVQEVNYNNKEKEQKYKELCDKIQKQQEQSDRLQKEYSDKLEIIENVSTIASEKEKTLAENYRLKEQDLLRQYNNKLEQLNEQHHSFVEKQHQEIERLDKELQTFQNTKRATIEALQREELLQKEQDNYRVVLTKNEEEDIELLQSVRKNLTNKRILDMLIWQTFVRDKLKEKILFVFPDKDGSGIYKITNLKNNKCYIGQAKRFQDRINQHFKHGLYIDTPQGNKLYEAMQQDGIQNFAIELLEECASELLNQKEKYYIGLYNAVDWGYNKLAGNN